MVLISNYSSNPEHEITFKARINSLNDKIVKVKALDDRMLENFKTEDTKLEVEQILGCNNNFRELSMIVNSCLNSGKQTENDFSSSLISSTNTPNNEKANLPN